MNLKSTPLLFGLLFGLLWLFGLMLAYKRNPVDQNLLIPSMQGFDVKIDSIRFQYSKEGKDAKDEVLFIEADDTWYVKQGEQKVRVEGFKIDKMIKEVQGAKPYEEEQVSDDLAGKGLTQPRIVVTFKGKHKKNEKEWTFNIGKSGAADFLVYVNSSERSNRAFPIPKTNLGSLFFEKVSDLRSKRLFDFGEPQVASVDIKEPKAGANKEEKRLALKKVDNTWRFEIPKIGFAAFDAPASDEFGKKKDKEKVKEKEKTSGGVRALITAIGAIHVDGDDDFEPLGTDLAKVGVEEGSETMRIEVGMGSDKPAKGLKDKKDEKKEPELTKEVLLIGKRIPAVGGGKTKREEQYYARLLSDQGVFRINASMLDAIKEALNDPARIRSHDIVVFDNKNADAVLINIFRAEKDDKGKEKSVEEKVKLLRTDDKDWEVFGGTDKKRKGSEKAIQALLDHLQSSKAILEFNDKDTDKNWGGFNGLSTTEITVYLNGVEKEKKEKDEKKDDKDKKDDTKDEKKKDEKKGDKKGDKKDEKDKKEEAVYVIKKGAEPFVKLTIGTVDHEKKIAYVKRVLQDGTTSLFTVADSFVDKLHTADGALAYVDPALPSQTLSEVVSIEIQRGKERLSVERATESKGDRWLLTDTHDPLGGKLADVSKVNVLAADLIKLEAKKWVKKDEPEKYGLKDPQATVTFYTKKDDRITAEGASAIMKMLAVRDGFTVYHTVLQYAAARLADKGDKVTIKFGKEIEQDKEKSGDDKDKKADKKDEKDKLVYVEHSGSDLVFLLPAKVVKAVRDADLRDKSAVLHTQAIVDATLIGQAAMTSDWTLLASPLIGGEVHNLDASKVNYVSVTLRTKVELRSFAFQRVGKDKTWVDQSGVKEFMLDTDKVVALVDQVCKFKTDRFASFGGPSGDNKLSPKEATVVIEVTFEDKSTVTLTVGAQFNLAGYFVQSSVWPQAVFFLPASTVEPWLRGAEYFGKERVAAGS